MCHSLWLPFPGLGYSINLLTVNAEKSCRLILPYHHYVRWNLLRRNLTYPNHHDPLLLPITIPCYFICAQSQPVEIKVLNDVIDASLKSPDRKKHEFKETESETIMYIVIGEKKHWLYKMHEDQHVDSDTQCTMGAKPEVWRSCHQYSQQPEGVHAGLAKWISSDSSSI